MHGLKHLLDGYEKKLLNQWVEVVIDTYPSETARLFGKKANRFDNPVGAVITETLESVINLFCQGFERDEMETALDPLIRIRAVQTFTAIDAVGFLFSLKDIGKIIIKDRNLEDFNKAIDEMVLSGFNRYMKCREDIFLLKATESKRRIYNAFERAGLVEKMTEDQLLGIYKDDKENPSSSQ